MRPIAPVLVPTGLLLLLGCTAPSEAELPFRPIVGTRLLMVSVLDPATDIVWDSVKTIVSLEGTEEFQPETEEEWTAVRNAAVVVAESGNLLMMGRRAVDDGDWIGWSLDLVDAGEAAMNAAEARNPEAIFDIGEQIYIACRGCHEQYWQTNVLVPE